MSKSSFNIIDRFKKIENRIKKQYVNCNIKHQYILYDYTNIDDKSDDEFIIADIITCLEKIPDKFQIINDTEYCTKSYIIELNSYVIFNNTTEKVNTFKIKFGLK